MTNLQQIESVPDKPIIRKKQEFKNFLKTIRGGSISHWQDIARAIGIDKDTIVEWKKTSEAQTAIGEGISKALTEMEKAGRKDWRMWESKLKMLGVSPIDKSDIMSGGEPIPVPIYGGRSMGNP